MVAVNLKTTQDVLSGISGWFKNLRLVMNLTQEELAVRSGVTLSSLKRFERLGLIALDSLLKMSLVLNCLDDFDKLAVEDLSSSATQSFEHLCRYSIFCTRME